MPKPKKGPRLGSGPAHQKLLLSGLASSLIRDGRVRTTEARAKAVRPLAERMITHAKKGDLAARRLVLRTIRDRDIVHHLFAEVAPRFAARNGGYTRITKIGYRKGDAAPMAVIELVDFELQVKTRKAEPETEEEAPKRRLVRRRKPDTPVKPEKESKAEKAEKAGKAENDEDAPESGDASADDASTDADAE